LDKRLERCCKEQGKGWELSGVKEEGEGEQKIMRWLRTCGKEWKHSVVIYGLDADLILLSMIATQQTGYSIQLVRETQEFESKSELGGYTYLDTGILKQALGIETEQELMNYIMLMTLMGNDFIPHSVTYRLQGDGHRLVLQQLSRMKQMNQWLVVKDTMWEVQGSVLRSICKHWEQKEEERMNDMIKKKQAARDPLPAELQVEHALVNRDGTMKEDWQDLYWSFVHPNVDASVKTQICKEYAKGCVWVLDYYTGQRAIDPTWMFPTWLPPLWSDLSEIEDSWLRSETIQVSERITPEEQLAMVLPLESWTLVRGNMKRLPVEAPQLWPLKFSFVSFGRHKLWECEANIPIIRAERIREILRR
jgi:5'-3' exonuclease